MENIVPYQDIERMALAVVKSNLFGVKTQEEAVTLMLLAQSENMHPMKAVQEYHIIQGKPALKADAMLARFQRAGGKVEWTDYTDAKVTGLFSHPSGGELSVTWTIEQATRIGLVKPGSGWAKFPRAMLRSRCISEGIRSVYPGIVTGTYTPEEVADFEPTNKRVEKDITPIVKEDVPVIEVEVTKDINSVPLYVPGSDEPYSFHEDMDDWVNHFINMMRKLSQSKKYDEDEKLERLRSFRQANEQLLNTLPDTLKNKIIAESVI